VRNTIRLIIEARCLQCSHIWSTRDTPNPKQAGEDHAAETGHEVRIVETKVTTLNHNGRNGKAKVTK
jgi:hypothetical protein